MSPTNQPSDTPLLDAIIAEGRISDESNMTVGEYVAQHNARFARDNTTCRWEPCTFILFGQQGETHEEYHRRKGFC